MTVRIGPYEFNYVNFESDRDSLELGVSAEGIGAIDFDSEDGDYWFIPLGVESGSTEFTGLVIDPVTDRYRAGLTVQLPSGDRVKVEGLKLPISPVPAG